MAAPQMLHDALDHLIDAMKASGMSSEFVMVAVNNVPVAVISAQINTDPHSLAIAYGEHACGEAVKSETSESSSESVPDTFKLAQRVDNASQLPDKLPDNIDDLLRDLKPRNTTELDKL